MVEAKRMLRLCGYYARMELRLYAAFLLWCCGRKSIPSGTEPWGYARLVTPMLWLWVFGSAVEVVVFHVIIPWDGIRLIVDIISVWGLVWMLGCLAANRTRPHLISDYELRVRSGVYHDLVIPREAIASAKTGEADLPSAMKMLHWEERDSGGHLSIGVSGRTNATLHLHGPTPIVTAKGVLIARTVSLWVDEPRTFAARLSTRAAA
jgi:hypothetical protein